ncbi:helix-turn-helix domain-containing protein [Vreelandella utahensis]|uniref:helix-turn-helix domain-containing protein n=1 Tax=Vreelandella halophila TaxID=86177 RepID=UPI0015C35E51|nr:helix-turn-helix domain-containing protein [Halomonas utahensis]
MDYLTSLASNLKRTRLLQGLTLSGLAQQSGIAKSTLSRLETGEGNPTIDTLWALANALKVPFGELVAGGEGSLSESQSSDDHGALVRLMERTFGERLIETYRMELPAGHIRRSNAHAPGVRERVVVLEGCLLAGSAARPQRLNPGESCEYPADVEHLYGAMDASAVAMVFIEYPSQATSQQLADQVVDWPDSSEQWEGVRSLVQRMAVEVATGLNGTLLGLRHAPADPGVLHNSITEQIGHCLDGPWPIVSVVGQDAGGAFWAALPLTSTAAFTGDTGEIESGVLSEAMRLAALAESPFLPAPTAMTEVGQSGSRTLDCLLSEISLHHGVIRASGVSGLISPGQHLASEDAEAFSSRIDVDQYAAYELLHPAYARQVVAMAEGILAHGQDRVSGEVIDIGTGPGTALLMLCELIPELRVNAVEPDGVAIAHLEAVAGIQPRILPQKGDFLAFDTPAASQDLLTSVGASHHFNTAFMLKKSHELLKPGGILCVADEFLPEFHDRQTRLRALVRHHSAYILTTAAFLDRCDLTDTNPDLLDDYEDIKQSLSLAVLEAQRGLIEEAVTRCRALYLRLNEGGWSASASSPLDAYVRFFRLEIQAMVAGFDYEVERKTYTRRFLEMARMNGFQLLEHRRVFATSGTDDWQGGTHVITLRKPEAH